MVDITPGFSLRNIRDDALSRVGRIGIDLGVQIAKTAVAAGVAIGIGVAKGAVFTVTGGGLKATARVAKSGSQFVLRQLTRTDIGEGKTSRTFADLERPTSGPLAGPRFQQTIFETDRVAGNGTASGGLLETPETAPFTPGIGPIPVVESVPDAPKGKMFFQDAAVRVAEARAGSEALACNCADPRTERCRILCRR